MQRITWEPHTYKRAALLLLVLALHIDSRRKTPTPHTLSSVPYMPRIPTPRKDNQRATHTPQLFAPLQAMHCISFLACFPACYPAYIPPTPQRLHGSPWKDCNQRAYHPPTVQPTPETETLANVQTVSESTCKRELHIFPHITPINCGHAEQHAASFRRRSTQPMQRKQATNAATFLPRQASRCT